MPYGKPGTVTLRTATTLEAMASPEPNTGCWLWTRGASRHGYGKIRHGTDVVLAHRLMFALTFGAPMDGMEVCHRCDTPPCINPDHLFLGSHAENMADSARKGRSRKGDGAKATRRKLDTEAANAIRTRASAGETHESPANAHGVSLTTISKIVRGLMWAVQAQEAV
jgi:hypothetical protein